MPPRKAKVNGTIVVGQTYPVKKTTYEVLEITKGYGVRLRRGDGLICLYALSDFTKWVEEESKAS